MGEEGWPDAREHLPSLAGAWLRTQQTETVVRIRRLLPCLGGKFPLENTTEVAVTSTSAYAVLKFAVPRRERNGSRYHALPSNRRAMSFSPRGPPDAHQHGRTDASTQPKRHDHAEPRREKPLQL